MNKRLALSLILALVGALPTLSGCSDDAFCFADCGDAKAGSGGASGTSAGGSGGTGGVGGFAGNAGTFNTGATAGNAGTAGACVPSGKEVCDGKDNDCDGKIDNAAAEDANTITGCGSCEIDCTQIVKGSITLTCVDGKCGFETCVEGAVDLDGDPTNGCEFACTKTVPDTEVCDGIDNDCNNEVDEGFDFCSTDTCGNCNPCVFADQTQGICQKIDANSNECKGNAQCVITQCPPGFVDKDHVASNGCEYPCEITNGGVEICDGLDNDCDGNTDLIDDLSADPQFGASCVGDPDGECAKDEHKGTLSCDGLKWVCTGPNVLKEGQQDELCNNLDDDCDGVVDEFFPNFGVSCGGQNGSSVGACQASVWVCNNGVEECPNEIGPAAEECNGLDDDCDDVIDGTRFSPNQSCTNDSQCDDGNPNTIEACMPLASSSGKVCAHLPAPSGQDCLVPTDPPMGFGSACQKGVWGCVSGALLCVGAVEPELGAVDACNQDKDCDGQYNGVVLDFSSDSENCGFCGNKCTPVNNVVQVCQSGMCVPDPNTTCSPGYYTCPNQAACAYQCFGAPGASEVCNGIDDNCDCNIDENPINKPTAQAVCGANPSSTDTFCKPKTVANPNGVEVQCASAAWQCVFHGAVGKYCDPDDDPATPANCAAEIDYCDDADNNCDGLVDEPYVTGARGKGKTCFSDESAPGTQGACRTQGVYVCGSPTDTTCNAVVANCNSLPGGCTELCDGIDNDCDGSIDEPFNAPGSNASFFVRPEVVKIDTSTWIFAYEASRPDASSTSAGLGNGYFNAPPSGIIADSTPACSKSSVIPWYDVSPAEAEQSCESMGGRVCRSVEWQNTCKVNVTGTTNNCLYSYDAPGVPGINECKSAANYTSGPYCNLGGYDFDDSTPEDDDGVIVTHSPDLIGCKSTWDGLNGVPSQSAYDITGNLREITRCQKDRAVCGASGDSTKCAQNCCSATSTVAGTVRLCGTLANSRRLRGQSCSAAGDCCADVNCTANGTCANDAAGVKFCRYTADPAVSCRERGVACTASNQCCNNEVCAEGFCGGKDTLPHSTYPLLGGSFATVTETGAVCDFDFYKVSSQFKLFDTGFRCCFDSNPNP